MRAILVSDSVQVKGLPVVHEPRVEIPFGKRHISGCASPKLQPPLESTIW